MKNDLRNNRQQNSSANGAAAVVAGVIGIAFAVFFVITSILAGAPLFFVAFGAFVAVMIIINVLVSFKDLSVKSKAKPKAEAYKGPEKRERKTVIGRVKHRRNRHNSEPDPWDEDFRNDETEFNIDFECGHIHEEKTVGRCPVCGEKVQKNHDYCASCGKRL